MILASSYCRTDDNPQYYYQKPSVFFICYGLFKYCSISLRFDNVLETPMQFFLFFALKRIYILNFFFYLTFYKWFMVVVPAQFHTMSTPDVILSFRLFKECHRLSLLSPLCIWNSRTIVEIIFKQCVLVECLHKTFFRISRRSQSMTPDMT